MPKLNEVLDSILPTFFPFETSSPELEDENVSKEISNARDGADVVYIGALEMSAEDKIVLLSDDMLGELIKNSEEMQQDAEDDEEGSDEDDKEKVVDTDEKSVERTQWSKNDGEEQKQWHKKEILEEDDMGSSADSEIPVDLDYAADSVSTESWNTKLQENKPLVTEFEAEEKVDNELPTVMEDYDTQSNQDYDDPKDGHQEQTIDQALSMENLQEEQILPDPETDQSKTHEELFEKKEGVKHTNESVGHGKGNGKKSKRLSKPQHDQGLITEVISENSENQELEKEPETTHNMAQRKRGKLVRSPFI